MRPTRGLFGFTGILCLNITLVSIRIFTPAESKMTSDTDKSDDNETRHNKRKEKYNLLFLNHKIDFFGCTNSLVTVLFEL